MKINYKNYNLTHRLIAYILLVGLFLQSCGGLKSQLVPQEEKEPSKTIELSDHPLVNTDKTIVISGGYLASFYEEEGVLKADLKADEKQPKPNYKGVPVIVEEGADLFSLIKLDPTTQKNRIELNRSHGGQLRHITICEGGLSGGMMEGDDYQEKENGKENNPKNDSNEYQELLRLAIKGDMEAQFQIGKRAYYVGLYQFRKESVDQAKTWLCKAANQGHEEAIHLLDIIKEIETDSKSKELLAACERLNFDKSLPIIFKQELKITYKQNNHLGSGTFGDVYKASYQEKLVAAKRLKNKSVLQFAEFQKECIIMFNHKHDNLVKFIGFCPEENCLLMEYVSGGSLWNLLKVHQGDSSWDTAWEKRYKIGLNVARGLCHLHRNNVVHADLKSENILLDVDGQAKITDFGTSSLKSDRSTYGTWGGTYHWAAPETFLTEKNSKAADVYSYGMVLWQLGARTAPFVGYSIGQLAKDIPAGKREVISDDTPLEIRRVIEKCWFEESERYKIKDVKHSLLKAGSANFNFTKKEKEEKPEGSKDYTKIIKFLRLGVAGVVGISSIIYLMYNPPNLKSVLTQRLISILQKLGISSSPNEDLTIPKISEISNIAMELSKLTSENYGNEIVTTLTSSENYDNEIITPLRFMKLFKMLNSENFRISEISKSFKISNQTPDKLCGMINLTYQFFNISETFKMLYKNNNSLYKPIISRNFKNKFLVVINIHLSFFHWFFGSRRILGQ